MVYRCRVACLSVAKVVRMEEDRAEECEECRTHYCLTAVTMFNGSEPEVQKW